eukprot:scaffold244705_cov33-Cyclotella_meneghiniana.AAC.1
MAKKGSTASRKRKSKEDSKAAAAEEASPAAQKQKTATDDAPSTNDAASVSKLAAEILSAAAADKNDLSYWIDNGTIEKELWPYFINAITNDNDNEKEDSPSNEAAFAIVLLTNYERSDSGGRGERLSYVVDSTTAAGAHEPSVQARAFALLLKCILSYQRIHCHEDDSAADAATSN